MSRADLLALLPEDLATLTNPGTLKRSQREIAEAQLTCQLEQTQSGDLVFRWSDAAECRIPASGTLRDGRCSCAAVGVCRHLVRSVLFYQTQAPRPPEAPPADAPWDPGSIPDAQLAAHFRADALTRGRRAFDQGLLAELVRGPKPYARFPEESCVVRFLVPGDPRYTRCDCSEEPPCRHVPLAVWAFRLLESDRTAGLLMTRTTPMEVPAALLDDLETALTQLAGDGLAGLPAAWKGRILRLQDRLESEGLVWPAEALAELLQQADRYSAHDARFEPERLAELTGELLIRADAIRRDTGAVPQPFIRGFRGQRATEMGKSRLIGLGCGVLIARSEVEITAYFQDADTGFTLRLSREFANPAPDSPELPKPFWQLARHTVFQGASLSILGQSQLLLSASKRSPGQRLLLGRARATVNPQAHAWEKLRSPLLSDSFSETIARLGTLPPLSLRPRTATEDFQVLAIVRASAARFDPINQTIEAVLEDRLGGQALLRHPYTSRGAEGAEKLLHALSTHPDDLRFVAGTVRLSSEGLLIHPVCLVLEEAGQRRVLQPWVDREDPKTPSQQPVSPRAPATGRAPEAPRPLLKALGELLVTGLSRPDPRQVSLWRTLQQETQSQGFQKLGTAAGRLAEALAQSSQALDWDWHPAAAFALELTVLIRLCEDLAT